MHIYLWSHCLGQILRYNENLNGTKIRKHPFLSCSRVAISFSRYTKILGLVSKTDVFPRSYDYLIDFILRTFYITNEIRYCLSLTNDVLMPQHVVFNLLIFFFWFKLHVLWVCFEFFIDLLKTNMHCQTCDVSYRSGNTNRKTSW